MRVLKDEDFEKVRIESTHSVEITDFVEQAQINPKFFYKPYFLGPQKGGEKGYALLLSSRIDRDGQDRHRQGGDIEPGVPRRRKT